MAQTAVRCGSLPDGIREILKFELNHYKEYKRKLDVYESKKDKDPAVVVTEYLCRIREVCAVIDYALSQIEPEKVKFIQDVYIRRVNSLRRYAIENYMSVSTAYAWSNEFFNILGVELGYIDISDLFKKKYKPLRGW